MPEAVRPQPAPLPRPTLRWRRALRDAIRDRRELCELLGLPASLAEERAADSFATLVPRGFVRRMRPGDPDDPLLLQVLPRREELADSALPLDAVGDLAATVAPGMLHKYHGRVLLTAAGSCAVNCRYCFRRHFPYAAGPRSDRDWDAAIAAVRTDASIREVVLSGGDPLVLSDRRLAGWFERIGAIPHVAALRIHTRLPIVVPDRVTKSLCRVIAESRPRVVVVLHSNHANEVDHSVERACGRLRRAGATLLNQSVLLRGVNDSVEALEALSLRLVEVGALPYYLHQLDRVRGVDHFRVEPSEGVALVEGLRRRLPGYAVPRYVEERPGEPSKSVLA